MPLLAVVRWAPPRSPPGFGGSGFCPWRRTLCVDPGRGCRGGSSQQRPIVEPAWPPLFQCRTLFFAGSHGGRHEVQCPSSVRPKLPPKPSTPPPAGLCRSSCCPLLGSTPPRTGASATGSPRCPKRAAVAARTGARCPPPPCGPPCPPSPPSSPTPCPSART